MPNAAAIAVDDGWRIPDELWTYIEPLLPLPPPQPKGGRPWTPARQALDGMFFVLRTGCQWKALPRCFGAPSTVHDRFVHWREAGVFEQLWRVGLLEFDARVGIDWEWQAMDGAITKAPLGGGEHRAEPDRPRQAGYQALVADRRAGAAYWPECRRRQSPRHETDGADAPGGSDPAAGADAGAPAASESG